MVQTPTSMPHEPCAHPILAQQSTVTDTTPIYKFNPSTEHYVENLYMMNSDRAELPSSLHRGGGETESEKQHPGPPMGTMEGPPWGGGASRSCTPSAAYHHNKSSDTKFSQKMPNNTRHPCTRKPSRGIAGQPRPPQYFNPRFKTYASGDGPRSREVSPPPTPQRNFNRGIRSAQAIDRRRHNRSMKRNLARRNQRRQKHGIPPLARLALDPRDPQPPHRPFGGVLAHFVPQ